MYMCTMHHSYTTHTPLYTPSSRGLGTGHRIESSQVVLHPSIPISLSSRIYPHLPVSSPHRSHNFYLRANCYSKMGDYELAVSGTDTHIPCTAHQYIHIHLLCTDISYYRQQYAPLFEYFCLISDHASSLY